MRLELAITIPPVSTEAERAILHSEICDALCEYTVHVLRNNVNPAAAELGAVGLDGTGKLLCRNGIEIAESLVASS